MEERAIISGITRFNFSFRPGFKTVAIVFTILIAEVFFGTNVYAQLQGVEIGDRIRITAPTLDDRRIVGTVASFSPTSLSLARKDTTLLIPYPLIQEVDISTGTKKNSGKGVLIGSVSGGLLLGGIAYSSSSSCNEEEEWCIVSDTEAFIAGAAIGGLGGLVFGGIIGSFIKTTRWKEVPIHISAGVVPSSYKNFEGKPEPTVTVRFKF